MFQTFISGHNSNFFSDKLVLTSVTPASSAPVLQTPKATSSTLYFDSLTVNAGNGGFLHCIQMDTSVNAANQFVSVGADIAFDADPKFFACLVLFFFQAEDGIRARDVTGVQTCALPILQALVKRLEQKLSKGWLMVAVEHEVLEPISQIGRASCRERVEYLGHGGSSG